MHIKIENLIDSGSYADVWEGTDILDRKVAVKVLRKSSSYYFDAMAHAKALARAQHPNIVTVFALESVKLPGNEEEFDGVVMEYIEGQTLQSKLSQEPLEAKEAMALCEDLINAIEHIHASGMVHNDLHSKNVLIANQRSKVIDILYTNSLSALSTNTREEKIRRDKRDLTTLVFDIAQRTKIEKEALNSFGLALQDTNMSFASMRETLQRFFGKIPESQASDPSIDMERHWESLVDPHFVGTSEYAEALNQKIPDKSIRILLIRAIEERKLNNENMPLIKKLWARLSTSERQPVLEVLSDALNKETPNGNWGPLLVSLSAIGCEQWNNLSAAARIRLEALITKDIRNGRIDVYSNNNTTGTLGTWALVFGGLFQDRGALIDAISDMLMSGWYSQNYIARHLFRLLPTIADTPERKQKISTGIKYSITNKAIEAQTHIKSLPESWLAEIGLNGDGTPRV